MNLLEKFKLGLNKSSSSLSEGINNIFKKRKVDQDILQEFEDLLIGSDVGIETAQNLKNDFEKFRIDKKIDDHKEIIMAALELYDEIDLRGPDTCTLNSYEAFNKEDTF